MAGPWDGAIPLYVGVVLIGALFSFTIIAPN